MLTDANPDDPLVPNIATQFREDREAHDRVATQWVVKYASGGVGGGESGSGKSKGSKAKKAAAAATASGGERAGGGSSAGGGGGAGVSGTR